jgi:hypothetical protein
LTSKTASELGKNTTALEIVGIARDGKYQETIDLPAPHLYVALPQQFRSNMTLFVHTAGDPLAADVPLYGIQSMRETFDAHGLLASRIMAQMVARRASSAFCSGWLGCTPWLHLPWRAGPGKSESAWLWARPAARFLGGFSLLE